MIHAYKLNGYNIILDQNSGCVHSVDPVAYDMITMYQDHDKEEIRRFILEKYEAQSDQGEFCFTNIYDTRTNQKQSYESRCKVKGNIVVLY